MEGGLQTVWVYRHAAEGGQWAGQEVMNVWGGKEKLLHSRAALDTCPCPTLLQETLEFEPPTLSLLARDAAWPERVQASDDRVPGAQGCPGAAGCPFSAWSHSPHPRTVLASILPGWA